ncbi:MAG: DinB family protein [Fimbriimonadaceae bacterium]
MSALVESWNINSRINTYLLDSLSDEQLDSKLEKGRTPRAQFAHVHNVRLMWLKSADPALLEGLRKLENDAPKDVILAAMGLSSQAISTLIEKAIEGDQRVKGFKPHATAYVGYLISHESHHRGQLEIMLRLAGKPISDKVSFGLWEWGTR